MTSGNSALPGLAQGTVTGRESRGSRDSNSSLTRLPRERVESVHPVAVCPLPCHLPVSQATVSRTAVTSRSQLSCWTRVSLYVIMGRRRLFVKLGHIYKPKNRVFLPAGINRHHGYDQRGQLGKLLPQTPPVAGSRAALWFSSAAFIVLCSPCHQRGWGSLPTWPGLSSSL